MWVSRATTCPGAHEYVAGQLEKPDLIAESGRILARRGSASLRQRLRRLHLKKLAGAVHFGLTLIKIGSWPGGNVFMRNGGIGPCHRFPCPTVKVRSKGPTGCCFARGADPAAWSGWYLEPSGRSPGLGYLRAWQRIEPVQPAQHPGCGSAQSSSVSRPCCSTCCCPRKRTTGRNVFDIKLLGQRLTQAVRWVIERAGRRASSDRIVRSEHGRGGRSRRGKRAR